MSSYYTIIGKSVLCPLLNEHLTLSAKYRFIENPKNPYEIRFIHATCPVVENSKLPTNNQCEEYKYYRCKDSDCKLLTDFPPYWDYRKTL